MKIINADCRAAMQNMAADSFDSIVTDPPYGLSFMGKGWDHGVPGVEFWTEALRVAKPGAHLLAFGGTRTFHRLACAIEDAGWEIRDTVMWVYGSGFPKSLNVSKAIDKRGGNVAGFAEFRDAVKAAMEHNGVTRKQLQAALGNHMLSHYLTAGSQPAVPVLRDYRIIRETVGLGRQFDELFNDEAERDVVGQKPSSLGGTVAAGERDADYIAKHRALTVDITAPATDAAKQWQGWGTALKPAWEPIIVARKPLIGTVAENVLKHGTGGINVDGCRVGMEPGGGGGGGSALYEGGLSREGGEARPVVGRWPANVCHDGSDEVVGLFPDGARPKPERRAKRGGRPIHGSPTIGTPDAFGTWPADAGGSAARFFYCAKASKADRDEGCEGLEERVAGVGDVDESSGRDSTKPGNQYGDGSRRRVEAGLPPTMPRRNHHPTVKPTDLMRYLCRLVTPPGGVVLDPFTGSGSTGKAAILEGFDFVGIEQDADYAKIAEARIKHAMSKKAEELPI